jgi:hypothetical protein
MKRLVASTQYGDWKGSVRADDSGFRESLGQLLVEKKLVNEGEHLIAASLWVGENHGKKLGMVSVEAYLFTGLEGYPNIQVAIGFLLTFQKIQHFTDKRRNRSQWARDCRGSLSFTQKVCTVPGAWGSSMQWFRAPARPILVFLPPFRNFIPCGNGVFN